MFGWVLNKPLHRENYYIFGTPRCFKKEPVPEVYLEPIRTSSTELFCENSSRLYWLKNLEDLTIIFLYDRYRQRLLSLDRNAWIRWWQKNRALYWQRKIFWIQVMAMWKWLTEVFPCPWKSWIYFHIHATSIITQFFWVSHWSHSLWTERYSAVCCQIFPLEIIRKP